MTQIQWSQLICKCMPLLQQTVPAAAKQSTSAKMTRRFRLVNHSHQIDSFLWYKLWIKPWSTMKSIVLQCIYTWQDMRHSQNRTFAINNENHTALYSKEKDSINAVCTTTPLILFYTSTVIELLFELVWGTNSSWNILAYRTPQKKWVEEKENISISRPLNIQSHWKFWILKIIHWL